MISDRTLARVLDSERRAALFGDLIRAALALFVVVAIALWIASYAALVRFMYSDVHMNDFGKFYYSARMFLDGQDMYGPSPATSIPFGDNVTRQFWNMNPPHFHIIMLPFAILPPAGALGGWAVVSLIGLLISISIITRELSLRWTAARVLWFVLGVVVLAATGATVVTGQLTFLLLALVTAAWSTARRGRWNGAAALLGIAVSVKPFLGVFVPYLILTRRFDALVRLVVSASACVVVGLVIFGPGSYSAWLRALGSVQWAWSPMNASVAGILSRTLADNPFYTPLVVAPTSVRPFSIALSVALLGASLWLLSKDRSSERTDRAFLGLLLTALLASPLGWVYYLWLIAGPAFALWQLQHHRRNRIRDVLLLLAAPGLVWPLAATLANNDAWWAGVAQGSIYAWSALFLWAAMITDRAGAFGRRSITSRARSTPSGRR